MALQLKEIFASLLNKPQFHAITADILFILILVELFRLLIIYLQEQRVSIGVSVEIALVSVLREVIVSGGTWRPTEPPLSLGARGGVVGWWH